MSSVTVAMRDLGASAPAGRRNWLIALGLSLAIHTYALVGLPQLDLTWAAPALPKPLEARIVQAPSPAQEAPAPVAKAAPPPKPRPVARPKPKPAPPAPISMPDPQPAEPADIAPPTEVGAADERVTEQTAQGTADSPASQAPESGAAAGPVAQSEAASAPSPTSAAEPKNYPLKSARLLYDLSYGENPMRVGKVTHIWSSDGERYFAETTIEASGLFALIYGGQYIQRSWGGFGPNGLVPSEYYVQRGRPDRGESARFDWDHRKVAFAWRNERRQAELLAGTQDPISMLHQIYFMRPLAEASTLSIASSRKLGAYEYLFLGEQTIATPMGELRALHVRRKDGDADQVDLWVDPDRGFLPVRVYYADRKGIVFDQRIREMAFEAAEPIARQ
jgi:hypothetical protein